MARPLVGAGSWPRPLLSDVRSQECLRAHVKTHFMRCGIPALLSESRGGLMNAIGPHTVSIQMHEQRDEKNIDQALYR